MQYLHHWMETDGIIKLPEENYNSLLDKLRGTEDLLPEGDNREVEESSEDELSEETMPTVFVDNIPARTSSGRIVTRPVRMDL